jgi:hypothetical protein
MERTFKTESVHGALCQHLRTRPDMGALKAMLDLALEARNPFEPKAARAPRRWFVLFALVAAMLVICLVAFSDLR